MREPGAGAYMHACARVCSMSTLGEKFGAEVRRRRVRLQLSQRAAARRAGISPSGWAKVEQALNIGVPERLTVIAIARALDWDPDKALHLAGLEPASSLELAAKPTDPATELDQLWSSLSGPQQWALVYVAATMVSRHQWPELDRLARPLQVTDDVGPDPTVRVTHRIVDTPPANGNPSVPNSRDGGDATA